MNNKPGNNKPRLLVLNPTCLDVIDDHRAWVEAQNVELFAEPSYRMAQLDHLMELLDQSDGVVLPAAIRGFPMAEQMAASKRFKVCSIAASGFEWLDIGSATPNGIVVCYAPGGAGAEVVAELVYGLMLAVARQIPFHNQKLCRGDETRGMGRSLFGKTLGVIGFGAIGREVALRAPGMKLKVVAYDPFPDRAFAAEHNVQLLTLDQLLQQSDFVTLHVRLSDDTREMIGPRELRLMKSSAYLINAARRELVDEAALVEAIVEKRIAGAGLDDPPGAAAKKLLGSPDVVFTPHIGNRAIEGVNSVCRTALEGAIQVIRGERPKYVVNAEVYAQGARSSAL